MSIYGAIFFWIVTEVRSAIEEQSFLICYVTLTVNDRFIYCIISKIDHDLQILCVFNQLSPMNEQSKVDNIILTMIEKYDNPPILSPKFKWFNKLKST